MYESMLEWPAIEIEHVQEEPALEIALPQVFSQPPLSVLQRGKLANVERLVAHLYRQHLSGNGNGASVLGPDYQELVNEFQPLFTWTIACWDFLLSTEGCRFVLRHGDEKFYNRGDYRVVTDRDYSRLVHRVFRQCVLEFAQRPESPRLAGFLRMHFWDAIVQVYRKLEDPPDLRQRKLTSYSYLRCVPYRFLNDFHHELVHRAVDQLPPPEARVLSGYFFHFLTLPATAQALSVSEDDTAQLLRRGLLRLLLSNRLVYCLLRQIERY